MIDDSALKRIEELHRLQKEGIISAEEFEKSKQDILFGSRATSQAASVAAREPIARPNDDDWLAWMILPLRRYIQFDGRSSRKEFWMFLLMTNLLAGALMIVAAGDSDAIFGPGSLAKTMFGLLGILILGVIIPFIAAEVRRFHDQDRSGWFALLNLIPYIGAFIVLVFMVFPGTKGDNKYGPDPR